MNEIVEMLKIAEEKGLDIAEPKDVKQLDNGIFVYINFDYEKPVVYIIDMKNKRYCFNNYTYECGYTAWRKL